MSHPIAVIQMVSGLDVETNLKALSGLVAKIDRPVKAIFLPENFAALGHANPREIGVLEESKTGPIRHYLASLARDHTCWIFAGTLPTISREVSAAGQYERVDPPRVRAASLVFNELGEEVARYDKMHMFDVEVNDNHGHYMESDTFEAGQSLACVDSPIGRVGLSVCYDIRFPELYRKLVLQGATSLTIPSAFTTTTGAAHFEVLMRSRAIENFCFTIASCQGGHHESGRKTHGHSMVVDPWGTVLAEAGVGEQVLLVDLDFDQLEDIRRNMPVDKQRKIFS